MTRNLLPKDYRDMEKLFSDITKEFNYPFVPRTSNYPPMNITDIYEIDTEHLNTEYLYDVEVALAGFSRDEITVNNEVISYKGHPYSSVVIRASKKDEDKDNGMTYITHGIAKRDIEQYVLIGNDDEVKAAKYEDGILKVTIRRVVQQPRQTTIEIL